MGEGYLKAFYNQRQEDTIFILHKYPSSKGIENFFRFFPNERLVIILRDGYSNVDSLYRAHINKRKSSYKTVFIFVRCCLKWRESIIIIYKFLKENRSLDQVHLIEYSALNKNTGLETKSLLQSLNLNIPSNWDEVVDKITVKGNTAASEKERNGLAANWKELDKKSDFDPVNRWKTNWSFWQRVVFSILCGHPNSLYEQMLKK